MKTLRVGLTGPSGVLGRRISAALELAGHQVVALGCDIRDVDGVETFVASVDRVIHAAALVPVSVVEANSVNAVSVNVYGTACVAAAAARHSVHLTYLSSSHVYEGSEQPVSEFDNINPRGIYGLTKWHGEEWSRRLHPAPLVLRLFSFFDSRQEKNFLVPSLFSRMREAPVGAELTVQGFHSVRDIADASWMAERVCSASVVQAVGTFNVGTGEGVSVGELARSVARILGRDDLSFVYPDLASDKLVADPAAAASSFNWGPFDLREALRRYANEL